MPNYCYNTLKVKKGIELIKKAFHGRKAFKDEECDFTFNAITRMEDDIDNPKYQNGIHCMPITDKKKNFDWYNWSCDNWGTKWDAWDVDIEEKNGILTYYFITAWTPPIPIYKKLIDMFKHDIEFDIEFYDESNEDDIVVAQYSETKNDFEEEENGSV